MDSFKNFVRVSDMLREVLNPDDLADTDLQIQWTPPLDGSANEKEYTARFQVDGDDYFVGFDRRKKDDSVSDYYLVWDMDRSTQGWWWTIKGWFNGQVVPGTRTTKFKEKGIGYTLKVFKGVFSAIREFVERKHPSIVEYEPGDKDLNKFYSMVAKRLAPKFGYIPFVNMIVSKDGLRRPAVRKIVQYAKSLM